MESAGANYGSSVPGCGMVGEIKGMAKREAGILSLAPLTSLSHATTGEIFLVPYGECDSPKFLRGGRLM